MESQKKSQLIFFIILIILFVPAIIFFSQSNQEEFGADRVGKSTNELSGFNTNSVDTPFSYQAPAGWSVEQQGLEINPLKGGGPGKMIVLNSPNHDKNFPEFFDPTMYISWFNFNPQAPLEDIVPLLNLREGSVVESRRTITAGRDAYHVVARGNYVVEDGEPPPYQTEYYLLRLLDEKLLEILIIYNELAAFEQFQEDAQTILNSLKLR